MNLPDLPSTFRTPPPEEQPWTWRLENAAGEEVTITGDLADQRFASQSEAESWVGEVFEDLTELGVDAVVLFEDERRVYGPMSLHAT
ncbi:hypothetical protein RDV89_05980 [Nocardioides zeae]|uniref:DUF2188 domain-containing protein n=1 Tax=Nocardioides imazamoxiresistens TaxID=3231893 RepID=A0ABU3PTU1_9ACTN|nr:hypothetical protein [Nocardioides zeae]MDT9592604.1 hypothetical protein [Nocardioides zeae]